MPYDQAAEFEFRGIGLAAFSIATAAPSVNKADQTFVTDAIQGDLAEVQGCWRSTPEAWT